MKNRRGFGQLLLVIWIVFGLIVTFGPGVPAWAHAQLTKSSPANGAKLTASPATIQAWFDDELAKGSILRVYDAKNTLVKSGGVLDAKTHKVLTLTLTPTRLAAGTYLVKWHVISSDDGKEEDGSFKFSIAAMSGSMPSMPALTLVSPANNAHVKNPVAMVIETPGDIKALTMGHGGMAGMGSNVHLHITVDGNVIMPATDQLKALGNHRYQYSLAKLGAGSHTVKVFWADDKEHKAVGMVHAATIVVE